MATLSFVCPECNRQHDRVRPELAGSKVRCKCGHVFRLGPKSSKPTNSPTLLKPVVAQPVQAQPVVAKPMVAKPVAQPPAAQPASAQDPLLQANQVGDRSAQSSGDLGSAKTVSDSDSFEGFDDSGSFDNLMSEATGPAGNPTPLAEKPKAKPSVATPAKTEPSVAKPTPRSQSSPAADEVDDLIRSVADPSASNDKVADVAEAKPSVTSQESVTPAESDLLATKEVGDVTVDQLIAQPGIPNASVEEVEPAAAHEEDLLKPVSKQESVAPAVAVPSATLPEAEPILEPMLEPLDEVPPLTATPVSAAPVAAPQPTAAAESASVVAQSVVATPTAPPLAAIPVSTSPVIATPASPAVTPTAQPVAGVPASPIAEPLPALTDPSLPDPQSASPYAPAPAVQNPYGNSAPLQPAARPSKAKAKTRRKDSSGEGLGSSEMVHGTSIAMMIVGGLLVLGVLGSIFEIIRLSQVVEQYSPRGVTTRYSSYLVGSLLGAAVWRLIAGVLAIAGGASMMQRQSYALSIVGAIALIVPSYGFSAFGLGSNGLGFLCGVWALVVLCQRDTRDQF